MNDETQKAAGFRPGVMQWILGAILAAGALLPTLTHGFSVVRIVVFVVIVAGWALWVWRAPGSGQALAVPMLAILTAFVVGAVVIALAAGHDKTLIQRIALAGRGYAALVDGAFLKPHAFTYTLVASVPLILTGLAVAIGFRAGLFNIGAEGQYMIGALCGVAVGYLIELPPVIHAIVAMMAGVAGGAIWGAIPGFLKAKLGAHEVINTIMMNFIAIQLVDWLVNNPMKDTTGTSVVRTPLIYPSAQLPKFTAIFGPGDEMHLGFVIAILVSIFMWWLMWKTTVGFELRTAGSNPDAAKYAGMRSGSTIVLAMAISGGLAGLAGTIEVQGLNHALPAFFSAGYGFDAIAVALLGQNHPFGVIPAAILFGALRVGSDVLQIRTGVSRHMISIIQALILLFVAAPAMVRWLYRLKVEKSDMEEVPLTRGWGG